MAFGGVRPGSDLPRVNIDDCSDWSPIDYEQRKAAVSNLKNQLTRVGVPKDHIFWGAAIQICLPADVENVRALAGSAKENVRELREAVDTLAVEAGFATPTHLSDASFMTHVLRRAIDTPKRSGTSLSSDAWTNRRSDIYDLIKLGQKLVVLSKSICRIIKIDCLDRDVSEIRHVIAECGNKWWRWFSPNWRKAQRSYDLIVNGHALKTTVNTQISTLDELILFQVTLNDFLREESLGCQLFGVQWQGQSSNWDVLRNLTDWVCELMADLQDGKLPSSVIDFLQGNSDLSRFLTRTNAIELMVMNTTEQIDKLTDAIKFSESMRFGKNATLASQSLSILFSTLSNWAREPEKLSDVAHLNHLASQCNALGLNQIVGATADGILSADNIERTFRYSYLWCLMQSAYRDHSVLGSFSGVSHSSVVDQFRSLDVKHLSNNRAKVARRHWDGLPNISAAGQPLILRREFEKRSRHLPLRKLVKEAGQAIQAIKPVFMMSPLSVAAYLTPGCINFEVVLFDEASQVRPVDAFGALLRGMQAVVVGDSKQLPPTSFFDTVVSQDDAEEEFSSGDIESILGLFVAQGAPERMLKWHYRSRHESLIAVSNQEFYDNSLVIFPSPDSEREHYGLQFHHLPHTVYDRGRSSTNREEAKIVAQHVMNHAKVQLTRPDNQWLSLGVAAFSMTQMQAVLDEVEVLRRQHPDCEPFFASDRNEGFFVKNLENVQGDERDVIYISVGYGRDLNGRVSMNFGPLNGEGGARRLNVLITRAKLRCEVFTNLTADDIDLGTNSSRGVWAFKTFLQYAQTFNLSTSTPTNREPDSPFEQQVIRLLKSMNYEVVPQVGCARYFIDMAIKDPDQPGRYLIGIECDGRTYHSAKSARDRDRLREQVLRAQGWRIHRIWSTDWIRQPQEEASRLKHAIDQALSERREELKKTTLNAQLVAQTVDGQNTESNDATIARVIVMREPKEVPIYVCATLKDASQISNGNYVISVLQELVIRVVSVEAPVHVNEVARRIAEAANIGRVSDKLRTAVITAAQTESRRGAIVLRSDFCWSAGKHQVVIRCRSSLGSSSRKLEYITPEEIQEAICYCLRDTYQLSIDQLPKLVINALLGFDRLSADNRDVIVRMVTALAEKHVLSIEGNSVSLSHQH